MTEGIYAFGPFLLDTRRGVLQRDGQAVVLGRRGLSLLEALLAADGTSVTKAELIEWAWPQQIVEEVNLTVQIAALRKTLGPDSDGREWITTVPRVGYRLPRGLTRAAPVASGPPRIAVLPFADTGSDPSQASVSDVLVDDFIAILSRFSSFAVAARATSFSLEQEVDAHAEVVSTGVRYLVQGSVRRQGPHVRVAAQLIDVEAGITLWADHFDGDLAGTFAFQDHVAETVAGVIEPRIRRAEIDRALRKRPDNLDAYDLCMRALPGVHGADPGRNAAAIELLERAIEMEPAFSTALAYAAWAYERRVTFGMPPIGVDCQRRCIELARLALRYGGDDPLALAMGGFVMVAFDVEPQSGLVAVRHAAAANPNNPLVLNCLGISNVLAGDLDEALTAYRHAIELSPSAPENYESLAGMGFAHFFKREFREALDWHLRALATSERSPPIYWTLVATYAQLGRLDEARAALERLREILPGYSIAEFRKNTRSAFPERFIQVEEGLRMAGLSET